MRRLIPIVSLLALACATTPRGTDAPRAPAYARGPHDTLRFREITRGTVTVQTPQGPLTLTTDHDATIALTFLPGDSARAWYEELAIGLSGVQGDNRPATGDALRKPFTLRFDARGRVRTLATPEFPASFRGVTDLTRQFDDYFLVLPEGPLRPGVTWSDTSVTQDSTAAGRVARGSRIARYRVERDTVVGGQAALVISARQDQRLDTEEPGPQPGMTARSTLAGVDTGLFVFAAATGRLIGRERQGELEGAVVFEGGAQPVSMPQRFRYANTLTALPQKP